MAAVIYSCNHTLLQSYIAAVGAVGRGRDLREDLLEGLLAQRAGVSPSALLDPPLRNQRVEQHLDNDIMSDALHADAACHMPGTPYALCLMCLKSAR